MTTPSFVVDTPDMIDAVRRAASIAPSHDEHLSGVRIEVQGSHVLVKACDRETTYRAQIPLRSSEGIIDPVRLPASVLSAYLQRLPVTTDSTVEFVILNDERMVRIGTQDCRLKLHVVEDTETFPTINAFDPDGLVEVEALASKMNQLTWACDRKQPPYDGIHLSGTYLETTDKFSMARVACHIPLDRPITAPLTGATESMRGYKGSVHLGVRDDKLLVMPDPDLQFRSVVYQLPWPPTARVYDLIMESNRQTVVDKRPILEALSRVQALSSEQKSPRVMVHAFENWMNLEVDVPQVGKVSESIDLTQSIDGEPLKFGIKPSVWSRALEAAETDQVTIGWPTQLRHPMYLSDGRGFEAAIALIVP